MKILICSDGSEQAERAVRLGAELAAGVRAEVTLLGIAEDPESAPALLEALKRDQSLLQARGIQPELTTKEGDVIAEIIKRTRETLYDLVVIGAVRKGVRGRFWMSTKSYKIVREIKPPVLLVSGPTHEIKRLLICSGGKRYIEPAVKLTAQLAQGLGAAVTLLHVMPELPAIYAGLPRMEVTAELLLASNSELGLNLRQEKETLEALGVPTEVKLRRGPVLEEILREIRTGRHDLIVTGSALSKTLRTYALGDISREIVNRADCAVLVVRSQTAPPTGARARFREWWGPSSTTA